MATNIYNSTTGATGYQTPGASLQPGWAWNGNQGTDTPPPAPASVNKSPVSMLSSDNAITKLGSTIDTHNTDVSNLTTAQDMAKKNADINAQNFADNVKKQGGLTAEEIGATGGDISNYDFVSGANLYLPKQNATPTDQYQSSLDEINKTFDTQQGLIDSSTANLMDNIKNTYTNLMNEAKGNNESSSRNLNTSLIRNGISRYAPTEASGILDVEAKAGLARLGNIAAQQSSALTQATQAMQEKNWTLFTQKRTEINNLKKDRLDALQKLQTNAETQRKDLAEKTRISDRDNSIATLLTQGTTDPATILANLTKSGIKTNAKEIADTIGSLIANKSYPTGPIGEYEFYASNEKASGRTPLSFNDYQNLDANRKIAITKAGISGNSSGQSDTDLIAQAIINGDQPPVLTGLYGKSAAVKAALENQGFNLTKATQDYTATQKLLGTLNGAQQTRLRQSVNQVSDSLSLVTELATQWDGGKFPLLNKVNLIAAKNGAYGPDAQSLATQLDAEIADITSELGTVYKGGNSSTDESLKLAGSQLSSSWSKKQLLDAIDLARKNIQYRKNSLSLSTAGIDNSQYNPNGGNSNSTYGAMDDASFLNIPDSGGTSNVDNTSFFNQ